MSVHKAFLSFALPDVDDQELLQIKQALDSGWITILRHAQDVAGAKIR
jgi:hypothetical protein